MLLTPTRVRVCPRFVCPLGSTPVGGRRCLDVISIPCLTLCPPVFYSVFGIRYSVFGLVFCFVAGPATCHHAPRLRGSSPLFEFRTKPRIRRSLPCLSHGESRSNLYAAFYSFLVLASVCFRVSPISSSFHIRRTSPRLLLPCAFETSVGYLRGLSYASTSTQLQQLSYQKELPPRKTPVSSGAANRCFYLLLRCSILFHMP
jgi:hypothetical protein